MNAASGRDMRQKFRGWNFPIDDAYYNQIYPILLAKIGQINCTNECVSGQKRCSGNQAQSCGNYDPDPCTEWKLVSNCPYGCANGACVQATYCYDNENNPNCICPDESVKEAFAICGTCPEGSVACSGFCQTKYRCVETPIYVYFTTDKPFYGLNEPVRVDVFGNIDSETVNVNIINPNGISGQLTLYKTEDSVKEFSVTSSYNHYTGNYTNTAITGKYFIDFVSLQGHLYKFNRGQFYVFDREQIERYLILKDIRDFIYQKYDINFYSQELTGYFAVYTRGDKQYLVYVYDFGDQEKIIKFLQQSVGYIKRHTITIDDYYIYEIDFDGRTAYLWSYNNILIIALESPTYTAIAEASSTSQFTATGMIATSDYCGTDSMNAQCVCYEKELKEEFMPPCATDVCTQVMHHRCVSYYPKSLLVAYMEKFPSDVLSKNTECSDNGGYCVPTTATCRQEYETSIYGCGFAESKCCVKKVTPEQLIEIVLKLEELKIKISELKAKADAISIYYFNTSDNANGNRFKQISEMLDDVRNKIDDVIKLIKDNKDNFDAVRDDIKNGIEDIKESIKDIADTLLSATCTQDSDCAVDKKCLNNICVDKCAGVPCPEYSKQCSDGTTARCTPSCVSGECGTCTATCPEGTQLTPTTTGTPVLAAQSASSNFAECLDQCNKNYGITSCWDYCTGGSVQSTTTTGSTSGGMVPSATIGGDKGYCYNANEGIEECDNCDCDSDSRDDPVNCIGVCDGITGCCRWSTEGGDGDGGGGYWGSGGGSDYCSDWLTYDPWYCSWYEMFAMA
jgi:gas vesicle protein